MTSNIVTVWNIVTIWQLYQKLMLQGRRTDVHTWWLEAPCSLWISRLLFVVSQKHQHFSGSQLFRMVHCKVRETWFLPGDEYTHSKRQHLLLLKVCVRCTVYLERSQLHFPLGTRTNIWLTRTFWGGNGLHLPLKFPRSWSLRNSIFIIPFPLVIIIVIIAIWHSAARTLSNLASDFVTFPIYTNSRSMKIVPSLPVTSKSRGLLDKLTVTHSASKSDIFF